VNRIQRPVRQNNSTKSQYNCLALIVANLFEDGKCDVEFLNFHTCCSPSQQEKRLGRLSQTSIADIEAQIEQGLTIDRILLNMRARFDQRDSRQAEVEVFF
jgi:hypothetical protein